MKKIIILIFLIASSCLWSQDSYKPYESWISAGNIFMTITSEGRAQSKVVLTKFIASDLYYYGVPAIRQDGIIWSGIVKDGTAPRLRAGGNFVNRGTQPGSILTRGMAENPQSQKVNHVWCAIKDYYEFQIDREYAIRYNKAVEDVTDEEIFNRKVIFKDDYRDWPESKGAPPRSQTGYYSVDYAAQLAWFVYNDYDSAKTMAATGSPPIGLEIQETIWAYDYRSIATRCFIVRQVRMFYKGTADTPDSARIDSMYVGLWADFESGAPQNDLLAYDSDLEMAYVYNDGGTDAEYEQLGFLPSVFGCAFLKGPLVPEPYAQPQLGMRTVNG
mgnify:CR=1 FL=1